MHQIGNLQVNNSPCRAQTLSFPNKLSEFQIARSGVPNPKLMRQSEEARHNSYENGISVNHLKGTHPFP
jgi:hypothetical protein